MASAYYSRNHSYSRSYNAEIAEKAGRLPLTRFCERYGLVPDLARQYHGGEWHHVGKYSAMVDYYDPQDFFNFDIATGHIEDIMAKCSRPRPSARQLAARKAARVAWLADNWAYRPASPGPEPVQRHRSTFAQRATCLIDTYAPGEGLVWSDFQGAHLSEDGFLVALARVREAKAASSREALRTKARASLRRRLDPKIRARSQKEATARRRRFIKYLGIAWGAKLTDHDVRLLDRRIARSASIDDHFDAFCRLWTEGRSR